MDIVAILFLIFGWVCKVKGLVITTLVLASVFTVLNVMTVCVTDPLSDKYGKAKISILIYIILLALSIIKLCIW